VIPPEESIVAAIRSVGFSAYGRPARRSAASTSNQPGCSPLLLQPSCKLPVGEVRGAQEPAEHCERRDVEVGALVAPLLDDPVDVISFSFQQDSSW
jgi:hypothetical protein